MVENYLYMDFLLGFKEEFEVKDACSEQEVNEIETSLGIKFPRAYREVYLILGKWYGFSVIDDNSYKYPDYKGMKEGAETIVSESDIDLDLGNDILVFGCVESVGAIYFLKLSEGEDPPVYEYLEDDEGPTMVAESYSSFIKKLTWYRGYLVRKKLKGK